MLLYYRESTNNIGEGVEFDNSISFNEYCLELMLENEREWNNVQRELYSLNEGDENAVEKKKNKFIEFIKKIIKRIRELFDRVINFIRDKIKKPEEKEKDLFDLGVKNITDEKLMGCVYNSKDALTLVEELSEFVDDAVQIINKTPFYGNLYDKFIKKFQRPRVYLDREKKEYFINKNIGVINLLTYHEFSSYDKIKNKLDILEKMANTISSLQKKSCKSMDVLIEEIECIMREYDDIDPKILNDLLEGLNSTFGAYLVMVGTCLSAVCSDIEQVYKVKSKIIEIGKQYKIKK